MTPVMIAAVVLFVLSFLVISTELINKTLAALLGGGIFIILGLVHQHEAFMAVDWNVIFLLVGMMIIVGITKHTGVFQYLAIRAAKAVHGRPLPLLIVLSLITAVLSALLDNVTTVLIITPVSILIAVELGISPLPFVVSSAIASNIGGTATLIGDPPNILIGSAAGLSFVDFIVNLGPVVLISLLASSIAFWFFFRKQLVVSNERRARIMDFDETRSITDKPLLIKSLAILGLVFIGFILHGVTHLEPATVSLTGAAILMLLAGKKEVEEFFREVEWGTIFFFIGLFIMVGALEELGVINLLAKVILNLTKGSIHVTALSLVWVSGLFSALVDNIPYVATMIPLVENMGKSLGPENIEPVWWALSLGACFGGNGTLIGASANVVSVGLSSRSGYKISFLEFTKYGVIITVVTLLIASVYLWLVLL
ncbi:ArsB/NhaD family transporter [Spirochaeta lutea]|uniref:Membrane protein n=1 Tax=Spirochaeta lutea TaxID=1480694 RepID=A0A098QTK1_9SPIO|nr:ArsB/NhaD family transporter [Spirochaeta lutea]KGE70856.1 membrane protein [Spirochaeta lutea]